MWENRSKLIFISCMLLSGTLFIQMGMYLLHLLTGWELKYNVIQFCHSAIGYFGFTGMGYILNVLVFHAFLYSIWFSARQVLISNRLYKKLAAYQHKGYTQELNKKFSDGKPTIIVICHAAPMAFAMGLLKPRIILSTGVIDLLDNEELQAVIYHEWFHKKHRDPLKTFMLSLISSVMWYIPILKSFHLNYKIVREVLADNYAIRQLGNSIHLGSALLKMLKGHVPMQMPQSHVSFADTSINVRIRYILEPQSPITLTWPFTTAVVSVQVLISLCAMFVAVMN